MGADRLVVVRSYLLDRCIMKRFTFITVVSALIILSGCILVLKCIIISEFCFRCHLSFRRYTVGIGHQDDVKEFYWSNGTPTNNGNLKVDNKGLAGHTGLDVNLNNITVAFTFPSAPTGLILTTQYGGNINVEVNGDLKNVQCRHKRCRGDQCLNHKRRRPERRSEPSGERSIHFRSAARNCGSTTSAEENEEIIFTGIRAATQVVKR